MISPSQKVTTGLLMSSMGELQLKPFAYMVPHTYPLEKLVSSTVIRRSQDSLMLVALGLTSWVPPKVMPGSRKAQLSRGRALLNFDSDRSVLLSASLLELRFSCTAGFTRTWTGLLYWLLFPLCRPEKISRPKLSVETPKGWAESNSLKSAIGLS